MITAETIKDITSQIEVWHSQGLSVGLVPTMGFLHEGHESLIKRSVAENDKTIVSDFVNPMQFGKNEDLETYPKDLKKDQEICKRAGADLIFHPLAEEMYPKDFYSYLDMTTVSEGLCGSRRPDHFRGVCTVVAKLFNIVRPKNAYFGQKDAQQLAVIQRMVKDFNFPVNVVGCHTVREADGLAKSSRNTYLTKEERKAAGVIYQGIKRAEDAIKQGERSAQKVKDLIIATFNEEPMIKIEYVEITDWEVLKPVDELVRPVLVAVAVRLGKTRLIDNYIWE
ncbi:MAG: pantoate--beta-alanine ligase [Anaerovoracaceae bacterium]